MKADEDRESTESRVNVSSVAADGCVAAAAGHEGDAMERAFDACAAALYRYFVVRTGDAHLADDLMQQLWLAAKRGWNGVPAANVEYWLRAIAKNLIRTHWRREARRPGNRPCADPALAAALAERLATEPLADAELERREVRDQLLLAITALCASDQELIIGCYLDGRSHASLAESLGVSERAVEGRLYRARAALREKLKTLE